MKSLNLNWLTEYTTDFEYKKYQLLAFLKAIDEEYKSSKLYPCFSQVISHYKNLVSLKEKQIQFQNKLPKEIIGFDWKKFELEYKYSIYENSTLLEVEKLIEYSIPKFKTYLEQGKIIFDNIEHNLKIEPIGIIPIENTFGYFIFELGKDKIVYEYTISPIEKPEDNLKIIHTNFINKYIKTISNSSEKIKLDLLKLKNGIANPNVYSISSNFSYPLEEAILPITKMIFLKNTISYKSNLNYFIPKI